MGHPVWPLSRCSARRPTGSRRCQGGVDASPKCGPTCCCLQAPRVWEGALVFSLSLLQRLRERAPHEIKSSRTATCLVGPTGPIPQLTRPHASLEAPPPMFPAPLKSRSSAPGCNFTPSRGITPFPSLPHPSHSSSELPRHLGLPRGDCNTESTAMPTKTLTYLFKDFRPIDLPVSLRVRSHQCGCPFKATLEQIMSERLRGMPAGAWWGSTSRQTSNQLHLGADLQEKRSSLLSAPHKWKFPAVLLRKPAGSQRYLRAPAPFGRSRARLRPFGSTWSAAGLGRLSCRSA